MRIFVLLDALARTLGVAVKSRSACVHLRPMQTLRTFHAAGMPTPNACDKCQTMWQIFNDRVLSAAKRVAVNRWSFVAAIAALIGGDPFKAALYNVESPAAAFQEIVSNSFVFLEHPLVRILMIPLVILCFTIAALDVVKMDGIRSEKMEREAAKSAELRLRDEVILLQVMSAKATGWADEIGTLTGAIDNLRGKLEAYKIDTAIYMQPGVRLPVAKHVTMPDPELYFRPLATVFVFVTAITTNKFDWKKSRPIIVPDQDGSGPSTTWAPHIYECERNSQVLRDIRENIQIAEKWIENLMSFKKQELSKLEILQLDLRRGILRFKM